MDLVSVPGNEIPWGMASGMLTTEDGVRLRYAVLEGPPGGRGTVCVLQGRSEYIERYFETALELKARGFAVALFDWRGQGGSQRLRQSAPIGHVRSFREYDRDFLAFMLQVALPDCPPPYYALAHSTGANVLLRALPQHNWFTSAVLSAPFVDLAPGLIPRPVVRILTRIAANAGLGGMAIPGEPRHPPTLDDFAGNPLTSDFDRFRRDVRVLTAEPRLFCGPPSFSWLNAALASLREVSQRKNTVRLKCPVLIVAAGNDKVVSTEASRQLARNIPGTAIVVVDGARHELLNERNEYRVQFWAAFDSFVDRRESQKTPQATRPRASA